MQITEMNYTTFFEFIGRVVIEITASTGVCYDLSNIFLGVVLMNV